MPQAQATKQNVIEPLDPKSAILEMTQVVENKKRNLEKRKQKLEILMAKPELELTEQQKEAVSHMGEVNGNIMYVGEILQRFREIQAQVDKWIAIEAKKEKQASKRNKQNAVQSATSDSTSQRTEPVGNGHATSNGNGNEVSADITPRSRGSICDPSGATEQPAVAEPVQAADAQDPASDLIAPLASVVIVNKNVQSAQDQQEPQQAPNGDAAPVDDAAPIDDEAVPLKETVTFVNSAVEGANEQAINGMQPVRGRSGPRRGNRGYYDGPPRDGFGPRYGRPPRRGGPYRGPRGGPHAPPSNRPPAASAGSAAN